MAPKKGQKDVKKKPGKIEKEATIGKEVKEKEPKKEDAAPEEEKEAEKGGGGGDAAKIIVGILIFLLLLGIGYLIYKKMKKGKKGDSELRAQIRLLKRQKRDLECQLILEQDEKKRLLQQLQDTEDRLCCYEGRLKAAETNVNQLRRQMSDSSCSSLSQECDRFCPSERMISNHDLLDHRHRRMKTTYC